MKVKAFQIEQVDIGGKMCKDVGRVRYPLLRLIAVRANGRRSKIGAESATHAKPNQTKSKDVGLSSCALVGSVRIVEGMQQNQTKYINVR